MTEIKPEFVRVQPASRFLDQEELAALDAICQRTQMTREECLAAIAMMGLRDRMRRG